MARQIPCAAFAFAFLLLANKAASGFVPSTQTSIHRLPVVPAYSAAAAAAAAATRGALPFMNRLAKTSKLINNVLLLFLKPTHGKSFGVRQALHAMDAKRKYTDPLMFTHACFLLCSCVSLRRGLVDLFLLNTTTCLLSFLYHRSYEKPGRLAAAEGMTAKALFIYGVLQLIRAPPTFLLPEICLCIATVVTFVVTNLRSDLYDRFHILMHIFPSTWAFLVSLKHTPLLVLHL